MLKKARKSCFRPVEEAGGGERLMVLPGEATPPAPFAVCCMFSWAGAPNPPQGPPPPAPPSSSSAWVFRAPVSAAAKGRILCVPFLGGRIVDHRRSGVPTRDPTGVPPRHGPSRPRVESIGPCARCEALGTAFKTGIAGAIPVNRKTGCAAPLPEPWPSGPLREARPPRRILSAPPAPPATPANPPPATQRSWTSW